MKLIGKVNIGNFMGRAWSVVEKLITKENFPAQCIDGEWQADTDEITAWRRGRPVNMGSKGRG